MKHRRFNESQKAEIWGRLTSGESIPSVAKAYGRFPNAIRRMEVLTGEAEPRARTFRERALGLVEREEISRGLEHGARAGSRTLNLGIKRRLTFLSRKCQEPSGPASRIRRSDASAPQIVLACHRVSRVSCRTSCSAGQWRQRVRHSRSYPRLQLGAESSERGQRNARAPTAFRRRGLTLPRFVSD